MKTWNAFASALVIFALASPAMADFSGDYDPANWTTTVSGSGTNSGSVSTVGAPASVTLTSTSDGNFNFNAASNQTDFTITATGSGLVSFDYGLTTSSSFGSTSTANAGALLNGTYTQLATSPSSLNGSYSFNVNAGDVFGFRVNTSIVDSNITGNFEVSNFSAPMPEPASMLLWGAAAAATGVVGWRRRRRNKA